MLIRVGLWASLLIIALQAIPHATGAVEQQVTWKTRSSPLAPKNICIGDTLRFSWTGSHSVWLAKGGPCKRSRQLSSAGAKSYTFIANTPGTFNLMCARLNHCSRGNMRLSVKVKQCSNSSSPSPPPPAAAQAQLRDDAYTIDWNTDTFSVSETDGVLTNDVLVPGCSVATTLAQGPYPPADAVPGDGSGWPLLVLEPNGAFRVSKRGFAGVKKFYYQVQDCNGASGQPQFGTVTLTFLPDPSTTFAAADVYTTAYATPLKVAGAGVNQGLFVNDRAPADCTEPVSSNLRLDRLANGSFIDYQQTSSSFQGDIWQADAHVQGGASTAIAGKVVAYQDGSFMFVPATGFQGVAVVEYTVMDTCNFLVSNKATVSITVLPPSNTPMMPNTTSNNTLDPDSPLAQICDGKTLIPSGSDSNNTGSYCEMGPNGTLVVGSAQKVLGLTGWDLLKIAKKCSLSIGTVNAVLDLIKNPTPNQVIDTLQGLATSGSFVCCIGSILPTVLERLFTGYANIVGDYPSITRPLRSAGNTILLMYQHTRVPVPDLEQVVVHYGHYMPLASLSGTECLTFGYHIYCAVDVIEPALLLHEIVHVRQFVDLGRSLAAFGRVYLQQYCDAGTYSGIKLEQEAYEVQKVLAADAAHQTAVDGLCYPNPSAWFLYSSNYSRCVDQTTASMADQALNCVCKNHQPFTGPLDPACAWLSKFSRTCDQCSGKRRLLQQTGLEQSESIDSRDPTRHGVKAEGDGISMRHLQSLVGTLPPTSPCQVYDPELQCLRGVETSSNDVLYARYTMWRWNTCREDWRQRTRSGTSTSLYSAVCSCYFV